MASVVMLEIQNEYALDLEIIGKKGACLIDRRERRP